MNATHENEMFERIASIKKKIIRHSKYDQALHSIETVFRMRNLTGLSEHLFCIGQSGTGKSTLKKQLKQIYPNVELTDRELKPYLCVDTPSKPTIGNMAEEVLKQLGEANYFKGSVAYKTNQILFLLRELDVKLVVLDELQHFIDHGNRQAAAEVSDWLKRLIDNSSACFVLMGLERASDILKVNEQLRRRFSQQIKLPPFSIANKDDMAEFAGVLAHLDKELGLEARLVLTPTLVKQIHFATNGIMDYMVKIFVGAFTVSVNRELGQITNEALEAAFTQYVWDEGKGNLNPFNDGFCWSRLDKPNMPFYRISV